MPVASDGHRQRMRQRAEKMNDGGMRPQDVVEFLLYYSVPRRDTREYAFALMEKFGSLRGIMEADEDELTAVGGLGPRSVEWLRTLGEAVCAYDALEVQDRPGFNNFDRAGVMLRRFFAGADYPGVWQFHMSAGGRLLGVTDIAPCAAWGESDCLRKALNDAIRFNAHSVIIGQYSNVPYTGADPYDEEKTVAYDMVLRAAGIKLVDHLILNGDDIFSMFHCGVLGWDKDSKRDNSNDVYRDYGLHEPDFDGEIYD